MSKLTFSGPLPLRARSFLRLNRIAIQVGISHFLGRRIAPDWDAMTEIGIRFWRAQFTTAMRMRNMANGRALFDSLLTETDDIYDVTTEEVSDPKGIWITPKQCNTDLTMLYLHGGGYAFGGPVSLRFGAMLAHHCKARLFMPDYRLTPEHPHPAQADDALAAWTYLRQSIAAEKLVVAGDSAGGHMSLMLLQTLKSSELTQPALCIAICPWTDIGARGDSLTSNDRYDLVQGWMALQFGDWLDPGGRVGWDALSPMSHEYAGLAPVYMLAGGREILRDMIIEFAESQAALDSDIMLDLWPDMPHNFLAYDSTKASSSEALQRLGQLIAATATDRRPRLPACHATRVGTGVFLADDDQSG